MYEMNKIAPSVGTECRMVQLASGFGQRHGMRVSSARSTDPAARGGNVGPVWATGGHSGATVSTATRVPTAVRVRKPASVRVPGAPPRGAPV